MAYMITADRRCENARMIQPRIAARLPLLAGREAERLLEPGGFAGKVVLSR
jgi:hypothetical protein